MGRRARIRFVAAFLAPAVVLYGVFVVYPLLQTFGYSAYQWKGLSPNRTFVGLDNFRWIAENADFWTAAGNSFRILIFAGVALIGLGVGIAHLMRDQGRLSRSLRGIFLFPQVVSLVVVAILWKFLYHPTIGLINAGLNGMGLAHLTRTWLGDKDTALGAIIVSFVWWALGFYVMLFTAGLAAIPKEVDEASELDGAYGWAKFRKITWPMLWSVKRVALTYVVINVLNIFSQVFLMTRGGDPDRATETMLSYLYEVGFENSRFGHASALAVVNFSIAMLLAALILFVYRRSPEEGRA